MNSRMKNPALVLDVNPAIQAMVGPIFQSGLPKGLLDLVGLRVSQLNTCELCIGDAIEAGRDTPEMQEKISQISRWREATCFSPLERTGLALAEAITTLGARYDSVPDALWSNVEAHFDERRRAALVLFISVMNMFNRINVSTRQLTADWKS